MKKKPPTRTGLERPTDKELIAHVREAPTTWVQFRAWVEQFETPWETVKPRINSLIDSGEFKRFAGGVRHADWVEPPNDEKDATETTESTHSVEPVVQGTVQEQTVVESEKHSDPVPNVEQASKDLNVIERNLFDAICAKPASAYQLAKRLDLLPQQVRAALWTLRTLGFIRRVGHSNGAVWGVGASEYHTRKTKALKETAVTASPRKPGRPRKQTKAKTAPVDPCDFVIDRSVDPSPTTTARNSLANQLRDRDPHAIVIVVPVGEVSSVLKQILSTIESKDHHA